MREIRPSGSEGGGGHKASPYPYKIVERAFARDHGEREALLRQRGQAVQIHVRLVA